MFCYCCESIPEVTVEVHSSPVLNEDGLAVSEPPSQGAFTVSLELEDLKPRLVQLERPGTLGLQVNYTDLLGGVLISKIVPDGLVDRWNADPKNPLVSVGDRIIALNGEDLKGDDLLERLKMPGRVEGSFFFSSMLQRDLSSVTDSSAVSWNSQVTEEEARRKEKKERKSRKQRHHSADAHADRPAKKDDGALPKPHNWAEEVVKASLDPQNQWEFPGPSGKAGYVGQLAAWEQCRPRERVSHAEDPGVWGLRPRARGSEVASRARERAEEVQRWERHHDSQQYIFGTPQCSVLPHEQIPISHKIRGLGRWDVVAELGREAWGRSPLAQRPLIRQDDAATGSAVYACGAAWRAAHDARHIAAARSARDAATDGNARPGTSTGSHMQQLLEQCGDLQAFRRAQDAEGKPMSFGVAQFADPESAWKAVTCLSKQRIGGQEIKVLLEENTEHFILKWKTSQKAVFRDEDLEWELERKAVSCKALVDGKLEELFGAEGTGAAQQRRQELRAREDKRVERARKRKAWREAEYSEELERCWADVLDCVEVSELGLREAERKRDEEDREKEEQELQEKQRKEQKLEKLEAQHGVVRSADVAQLAENRALMELVHKVQEEPREELFTMKLDTAYLRNERILERKLRPWLERKIEALARKLIKQRDPLIAELERFLDEFAEPLVERLWRMLALEMIQNGVALPSARDAMSEAVVGPYLAHQVSLPPPLLPKLESKLTHGPFGEALTPHTGIAASSPSTTTSSLREQRLTSSPSQLPPVKKEKRRPAPLALMERAASRQRSGGNARCKVPERIVLPRVVDVIDSFRYLWSTRDRMKTKSRDEEWELDEGRPEGGIFDFEMVTADLSDAYCHLPVHPEEHQNCLSPGLHQSETLMWVAMLFGFKGAPLLMGRFAACLARIWQSLIAPSEMQSQLYMDDPIWILRGPTSRRNRNLALLLYTARALGINLAWHKGSRGSQLTWIGVMFEVVQAEAAIKLTVPKKMMAEAAQDLEAWESRGMVSVKEVQQLTGRLSWIAGILPRTRWAVSIMYAVLGDAKRSENEERQRAAKRVDQRPKVGLIAVKRLELPRRWFVTLFKEPAALTLRTEPMVELLPDYAIVTDASPQGIGALLATVDNNMGPTFTIIEGLEIQLEEADAKWLGVPWNESASQGPLEAWAIKLAVRRWATRLENKSIVIRSDSVVALAMARKLSSPSPVVNWVGAELAIRFDKHGIKRVITQHIPGNWNARRSRMQQQQRHMTASFLELHQFHDVKTPRSSPLRIGKTLVRGVCPVHLAAYLGDATALLLLLDAGADPEQLTEDRKDAEDVALLARKGSSHNKFLRVLQAAKARVLEIQSDYCASEAPRRCRCRDGVCYECDQLLVASF
eukprot:g10396.t1